MKKTFTATVNRTANGRMFVENLVSLGEKKTYVNLSFDEIEELDKRAYTVCMVGERTKLRYVDNLLYIGIYNIDGTANGFSNVDGAEHVDDIESFILIGKKEKEL